MDRLVSKIFAGGLSAGVFLFWWPDHVHGEGLEQLVLRGLLWTLMFELLLIALGPAEVLLTRRLHARVAPRRERFASRLTGLLPAPARTGGVVALACCGIAAPLALLADAPRELIKSEPQAKVVKQVIVERPVIEKKVVVRKVVAGSQPLVSQGAAPSVPGSQTGARCAARPAVAPERTSDAAAKPKTAAKKTGADTDQQPAATTTPATSPDASAPATQTAPAAQDTAPAASTSATAPAPAPAP